MAITYSLPNTGYVEVFSCYMSTGLAFEFCERMESQVADRAIELAPALEEQINDRFNKNLNQHAHAEYFSESISDSAKEWVAKIEAVVQEMGGEAFRPYAEKVVVEREAKNVVAELEGRFGHRSKFFGDRSKRLETTKQTIKKMNRIISANNADNDNKDTLKCWTSVN